MLLIERRLWSKLAIAFLAITATATTELEGSSSIQQVTTELLSRDPDQEPRTEQRDNAFRIRRETTEDGNNLKDRGPPSWEDLDNRSVPSWYGEAKFGIFVHWGVFSVPGFCSEWFGAYWRDGWGPCATQIANHMNETERPNFAYQEFAPRFQAELYNATAWGDIFAQAGAQYVVLTSKHHEGYCMWNSTNIATTWQWNVMDVGPRRDLLGELAQAVMKTTSPQTGRRVKFGVYHSLYEWFNPLFLQDKKNNFTTNSFVQLKTLPELRDLVEQYQPELLWSDGEWEAPSDYWQAREFLHWYASQVPTGIWNDRWGTDTLCKHGDFLTCNDRYNPGHLVNKKWENALTIDKSSWGWNRLSSYQNYLTTKELIHSLIETVAYNGNFLLNVGPGADGTLSPIFVDRLLGIGEWLQVNGVAIYDTLPWNQCPAEPDHVTSSPKKEHGDNPTKQNTTKLVYYTRTKNILFAHLTEWPLGNQIHLSCPQASTNTTIRLLGYSPAAGVAGAAHDDDDMAAALASTATLTWRRQESTNDDEGKGTTTRVTTTKVQNGMLVDLPLLTPNLIPCQYAWVLHMTDIANLDDEDGDGTTRKPCF